MKADSLQLRSRAWLARGLWDCDEGTLELDQNRLRFVTAGGEVRVDVEVGASVVSFPRWIGVGGLTVRMTPRVYRVWFSNPYVAPGGFMGSSSARVVAREWQQALKALA